MMRLMCGALVVLATMIAPAAADGLPIEGTPRDVAVTTEQLPYAEQLAKGSQVAEARDCPASQRCEPVTISEAQDAPAQYSRLGGAVLDLLRQGSIFVLH